jgi:hypothetical protein
MVIIINILIIIVNELLTLFISIECLFGESRTAYIKSWRGWDLFVPRRGTCASNFGNPVYIYLGKRIVARVGFACASYFGKPAHNNQVKKIVARVGFACASYFGKPVNNYVFK